MKAAIFEMPGLENLKVVDNAERPKNDDHNILIKVKMAGINPIDYFVVSGSFISLNIAIMAESGLISIANPSAFSR